jgi:hypothetical protein
MFTAVLVIAAHLVVGQVKGCLTIGESTMVNLLIFGEAIVQTNWG